MGPKSVDTLDALIDRLKVYDKKAASDYEYEPKEPKETMRKLVKAGKPAVEPLLELLKNPSKCSCFYATKVLGEIGEPSAVQPLLDLISHDEYVDTLVDNWGVFGEHLEAICKIGIPSLEPTLSFLEEKTKQGKDGSWGVYCATEILAGIKDEKSFNALVNMLSKPGEEEIDALVKYGDKRAIGHLKKLLTNNELQEYALNAIRKLSSVQEYRSIAEPFAVKSIESFAQKINQSLSHLQFAHEYPTKFEGDDAKLFNSLALELKIQNAIYSLLSNALKLGSFEAAYTDALREDFEKKLWQMQSNLLDFKERHKEETKIVEGCFPEEKKSEITKSYKGLVVPGSWDDQPKLNEFRSKIMQWLKSQDFLVTKQDYTLWARKGTEKARQGCYIYVTSGPPRTWGNIKLVLWGNGWSKKKIDEFNKSFWEFSEGAAAELLGTKKVQSRTIES
jgi:HEAT repeat protein